MEGFDFGNMMKQAKALQDRMESLQSELEQMDITGTAVGLRGGIVKIVCNGKLAFKSVSIDQSAIDDPEMLEDLVLTALKDANQQVSQLTKEKMGSVTAGMNLPGLNLPGF